LPKYHVISVTRFFCAHFRKPLKSTQREFIANRHPMGRKVVATTSIDYCTSAGQMVEKGECMNVRDTDNGRNTCCTFTLKGEVMTKPVKRFVAVGVVLSVMTLGLVIAGCGGGTGDAAGVSSQTVNGGNTSLSAPAAPTGVTAVGGAGQVTISWPAVSSATSYNVYFATATGVTKTNGTSVASVTSPYVHTGLTVGTVYFYIVTAVNSAGESAASQEASAATASTGPVLSAPATPTALTVVGGTGQVTISWPAVATATSYNVYYSTTTGVTMANGTKLSNAANPLVQTGLAAGTTYYYIVTAMNSMGESAASTQMSATTLAAIPAAAPPATPTGVTATGGANQVTVSWPAVSGATSYNIYYSTAAGVTTASGTKIASAATSYVQTGLTSGTTYYYIITAVNSSGESAASAQASAATTTTVPAFDALSFYNTTCLGCHGSLGVRTAAQITAAISSIGSMKNNASLKALTAAQIAAIAAVSY
jgi:fibronectin type 3 domain-containing protein